MKEVRDSARSEIPSPSFGVFAEDELLSEWAGTAIMLVDLDAFFAAVEQLDHPAWRGKPLIVGGDADKRGVVSTASYEARKYGVGSAMPSSLARRLCPDAIWTRGNYARYKEVSSQVMKILYDESPFVQQVSIDEAFVDISPTPHNTEHPVMIARRVQSNIEKLGVTASIGLGTSKTIAKIASDLDKPRGLTVVFPGRERGFLSPLPIRVLSGIGAASEETLHKKGIETLGDIANTTPEFMEHLFGKSGLIMHTRAQGKDDSPLVFNEPAKSISHEISFALDLINEDDVVSAIHAISAKVGRRLRMKGLKGHTLSLKVRYDDRSVKSAQRKLDYPTDDDLMFAPIALELLSQIWKKGMPVRLLGVSLSGFEPEDSVQDRLFNLPEEKSQNLSRKNESNLGKLDKKSELLEATDRLKDKFGEQSVRFGYEIKTNERTTGSGSKNPSDYR